MHKEKCYQNDMHANYMHMVHATLPRHCKYRDYNGITNFNTRDCQNTYA